MPFDIRTWTCDSCGTKQDRDINADLIIRDEGLGMLTSDLGEVSSPKAGASLASGTGATAYRPDVRRNSRGSKKSTVTQSVG